VAVKVNDQMGSFFQTQRGVRQGDPLSPIIFNLVADMLATLINRAKVNEQVEGLVPHLVDGGLSILRYAYDTILFLEHNLDKAMNMKLILCAFEQLSGLKINFHKSEVFCYGKAKEEEGRYTRLFICKSGGMPLSDILESLCTIAGWLMVIGKQWKPNSRKLSSWKGKLMSVGGRLVLINYVLTSLAIFMMSFFEVPKGVLEKIDYFRSHFFGKVTAI
jgi:hypothetical protein